MALKLVIPKEIVKGEKRVALVPTQVKKLVEIGLDIYLQAGAGESIHLPDTAYEGVKIIKDSKELYGMADLIFKVQPPTESEVQMMKENALLVSFLNPFNNSSVVQALCHKKITAFGMEMIPRISRAQSMDALSSQATAVGYKGVLIAANESSCFFPMMTTAAGTIRPSKVLVLGAGVAGLQAIATARRLGAIVEAYDVRPETKEQVESLGARFVQTQIMAVGEGGYARELTAEEKQKQADILEKHITGADVVICTAGVPGRPAPKIITKEMVGKMKQGAVVVDLLAESGGNCELTEAGKNIVVQNITICGPIHVASSLALHASEMYGKNIFNLIQPVIKEGALHLDWNDEVIAGTAVTHDGKITHEKIREAIEGVKA